MMMIRKATESDLSIIQDLNHELFQYEKSYFNDDTLDIKWPYSKDGREYFIKQINDGSIYVAIVNNQTIGYLSWYIYDNPSRINIKHVELDNMFVKEEYRKLGIGKLLIGELKKLCMELSIAYITVSTNCLNYGAVGFYNNNGFNKYEVSLKCSIMEDK